MPRPVRGSNAPLVRNAPRATPQRGTTQLMRFSPSTFTAILLVIGALGGCAGVAPYQREALTQPGMESEQEAEEAAFRSHVYDARSGAAGGHGSTGGGCGCN